MHPTLSVRSTGRAAAAALAVGAMAMLWGCAAPQEQQAVRVPLMGHPTPEACNPCGPGPDTRGLAVAPRAAPTPPPSPVARRLEPLPQPRQVDVLFAFDSDALTAAERAKLQPLRELAQRNGYVSIRGSADAIGTEPYNQKLSHARAVAVRSFFEESGMPANRIRIDACATCYTAPNSTSDGRQLNRRATVAVSVHTTPGQP